MIVVKIGWQPMVVNIVVIASPTAFSVSIFGTFLKFCATDGELVHAWQWSVELKVPLIDKQCNEQSGVEFAEIQTEFISI